MSESGLYSGESESEDSIGFQDEYEEDSYDYTGEEEDSATDEEGDYYQEYSEAEEEGGLQEDKGGEEGAIRPIKTQAIKRGPAFTDLLFVLLAFFSAIVLAYFSLM